MVLKNLPVRGAGDFRASIRVGNQVIALRDRYLFMRPADVPCPNCAAHPLSLVYEVKLNLREVGDEAKLSLESAVFYQNRRAPVNVSAEVVWA